MKWFCKEKEFIIYVCSTRQQYSETFANDHDVLQIV